MRSLPAASPVADGVYDNENTWKSPGPSVTGRNGRSFSWKPVPETAIAFTVTSKSLAFCMSTVTVDVAPTVVAGTVITLFGATGTAFPVGVKISYVKHGDMP